MSRLNIFAAIQGKIDYYKSLDAKDKTTYWKETLINNALYILLIIAIIYTYSQNHKFLSGNSIVNIVSLSAANIPIACGIAGCIVLTGTDLSAGRVVGLTACISASLLQSLSYATRMFPDLPVMPIWVVIPLVMVVGGIVGWVNGFFVAKFKLHPFIVTLATQLIVYGALLMYVMINGNNGQPLSGLDDSFKSFVTGSKLSLGGIPIPNYVWYAIVIVVVMWFIWNKTAFGKNMFAVGSNPEAANVSGGVSFVGGTGKISGVVLGVFLLRIIFVALNFLSINQNLQYIIKGLIILVACSIDMRKYLVRK